MQDKFGYIPNADNDKRIKAVLKNAKLISSGILSCWINTFEYDYYDIVKDFESLLATQ